jgi:hypothetical protein
MIPSVVPAGAPGCRKEGIKMRLLGIASAIRRVRLTIACLTAGTVSLAGLIVAPTHAHANGNIAAGVIALDLSYGATVLNFNTGPCGAVSPTLSTIAGVAAADSAPFTEYAGPVALSTTAATAAPCANVVSESGTLSAASFSGTNLGAALTCNNLSGSYVRFGPVFTMELSNSSCSINGVVTIGAALSIQGVWAPTTLAGTTGVTDSKVVASFVLTS